MDNKFGKEDINIAIENICGRLRQFVREFPDDKTLTIDSFAERITFDVLYALNEFNLPVDKQLVVATAMGVAHACMQTLIICDGSPPPPNTSEEIYWDDTVH